MRIFGLNFTTNPDERNPIACASCVLESQTLHVNCLAELGSLEVFENFLNSEGPWTAGIDFPFGQPRRLVKNLGWPLRWEDYVGESEYLGLEGFADLLNNYRLSRAPCGDQHLRAVDTQANASSAASLYRIPIGQMFQTGAPVLRRSPVSVLPCRPNDDDRVVVEAYPALVSSRLVQDRAYKSRACEQTAGEEELEVRRLLVNGLVAQQLAPEFEIELSLDQSICEALIGEASGMYLDAVLCAIQAAWATKNREHGWGIPPAADALEGWIVDPALLQVGTDRFVLPMRNAAFA